MYPTGVILVRKERVIVKANYVFYTLIRSIERTELVNSVFIKPKP